MAGRIIEIAGVVSGGKTTIAKKLLKQENVVEIEQLLPFWSIIKFIRPGLVRNLLIEFFFVTFFNYKLLSKIKHLETYLNYKLGFINKINFKRSIVRKVGFCVMLLKSKWAIDDKDILIDEGLFQIIQNIIDKTNTSIKNEHIFELGYKPDLLILVTGSVKTILTRCQSRDDLTRRFRALQAVDLENIIQNTITAFDILALEYANKFKIKIIRSGSLELCKYKKNSLVIFDNT